MSDKIIPLSVPNITGNELKYVTEAVQTEWVSTVGSFVRDFETRIAGYVGMPDAVACQSGTAALHIALMLSGVCAQDIVLVPALTFIAAVNPVRYIGATPVFMDCDDRLCMDPVKLETYCSQECHMLGDTLYHNKTGKPVRAVVVVHVFGNMADMPALMAIAERYHLRVIEDATEALGTHYTDGSFGNAFAGTMGHICAYSFNGNKLVTTGGGGMLVSKDEALLKHARHLTTQAKSDPVFFQHDEVGYNYRLTNLQAALGIAQMERIEEFIAVKERNYQHYCNLIASIEHVSMLPFARGIRSNHWFYSLKLEDDFPLSRNEVIHEFDLRHIQSRPIWGLICDQLPYRDEEQYLVETARDYERRVVNLPCSTNLKPEDVETVVSALRECIAAHGGGQ